MQSRDSPQKSCQLTSSLVSVGIGFFLRLIKYRYLILCIFVTPIGFELFSWRFLIFLAYRRAQQLSNQ
jgi:hypothetical protein